MRMVNRKILSNSSVKTLHFGSKGDRNQGKSHKDDCKV